MTRNLKVLGLALAAVFAMSAIAASSAFAAEENFHSDVEHTIVTAAQDGIGGSSTALQTFTTPAGKSICNELSGEGTLASKTSMEFTLTNVKYTGCIVETIFGNINVTIAFNECDYLFTTTTEPVHILCPAGKVISIKGPGCTITVPAQTVKSVHYHNIGAAKTREITVEAKVTGITSSAVGPLCSAVGESKTGTYTGNAIAQGKNTAGEQVGIWWE